MVSPSGSRSGDITFEARFFLCAGVETTVHEGRNNAASARNLRAKDMSVDVGTVVDLVATLKNCFDTVVAFNFGQALLSA